MKPVDQIDETTADAPKTSRPGRRTVSFSVPSVPRPKIKWRSLTTRLKAGGLVLALVAGLAGGLIGSWLESEHNSRLNLGNDLSSQRKIVTSESQLVSSIAKSVGPSVVSVNVRGTSVAQDIFGFSQPTETAAAGTGIIISSGGLIITNRHVVPSGTTSVSVTLSDGTELKNVQILGRTSENDTLDVAFLKVTNDGGHKLVPAALGDSAKVQVGDPVVAIGNALGQFQNTVTSGIISGFGRNVEASDAMGVGSESLDNLFQTDAAINEGNSGGPLVNLNGQVIGINTAIAGGAQNIGFAIPINDLKGLIGQVFRTGKFARPYLGVRFIPLSAAVAKQYDLPVTSGAYIAPAVDASTPSVVAGSPADKGGLKEGDIIIKVNGQTVDQAHSLTSLLAQHQVGDKVTLVVVRDGKHITKQVVLEAAPSS